MANPKLPPGTTFSPTQATNVLVQVQGVTPLAAQAMAHHDNALVEAAERTHAVPSREMTKQVYAQTATVAGLGGAALAVAAKCLEKEHLAWVLVALFSALALERVAGKIADAIKKRVGG